ncbi:MAG TPA: carboxypeptidase-like regulatory domain-containing protein [Verrucomicrobiae bacterium]|nr:carboxypeptidase-like regulatory domain-containing protein [Verrucomicrobiae bacterium]
MKTFPGAMAALLVLGAGLQTSNASQTGGFVFCDTDQSGQFDSNDTPIPGVLVVVTNVSGTFSNANFTDTPDGGFVLDLPPGPDSYVEYLHPLTLPSDATVVQPPGGVYTFTLDGVVQSNFLGNFLVSSSSCASNVPPPPPPPATNICCLKATGVICGKGRPLYAFTGSALPGCGSTNGDTGEWNLIATCQRLRFEGQVFEITDCGEVQSNGCDYSFIEFQGAGNLTGLGNCHTNYGVVYFSAHAEDHGHSKKAPDQLYFRVYGSDGTTLLLIGGDTNNPMDVIPVPLSKGDLDIGHSCCQTTGPEGGENEGGHNHQGQGNCDQGHGNPHGNNGDDQGKGDDNHGGKNGNCNNLQGGQAHANKGHGKGH